MKDLCPSLYQGSCFLFFILIAPTTTVFWDLCLGSNALEIICVNSYNIYIFSHRLPQVSFWQRRMNDINRIAGSTINYSF